MDTKDLDEIMEFTIIDIDADSKQEEGLEEEDETTLTESEESDEEFDDDEDDEDDEKDNEDLPVEEEVEE